jgi:predicted RNase H-like HicB family nuclease
MSKKQKRLERMRRYKWNISYKDFIGVLGEYGYWTLNDKGSLRGATVKIAEKVWTLTFVEAYKGQFMHHKDVDRLLNQIDEIEAWQAELEIKKVTMTKDINYYMNLAYPILLTPPEQEEDGWYAEILLLDSCATSGDTQAEVLTGIEAAKRLWLEMSLEQGVTIPEPERVR